MVVSRRSSMIGGGSTFSMESTTQTLQREIQALRRKTQEALQSSRDEIARLEDEIEVKQASIVELKKEIEELEADQDDATHLASLPPAPEPVVQPMRRWSIAGGLAMLTRRPTMTQNPVVSVEPVPSAVVPGQGSNRMMVQAAEEEEANAKKLLEIEQENQRVVEKHETDLAFAKEQVAALRDTATSQEDTIEKLKEQIEERKAENPRTHVDREEIDDSSEQNSQMTQTLTKQNERITALRAQIRTIENLRAMSPSDLAAAVDEMKTKVEEAKHRYKSTKDELNDNLVSPELERLRKQWSSVSIRLGLMDRVSQKCVRKVEKRANEGKTDQLHTILDRATLALSEEVEMRDPDSVRVSNLRVEAAEIEEISDVVLNCATSFVTGVEEIVDEKVLDVDTAQELAESASLLNNTTQTVEDVSQVVASRLHETLLSFEKDEGMIDAEVIEEMEALEETKVIAKTGMKGKAHSASSGGGAEEQQGTLARLDHDLETLRARDADIQEKIQMLTKQMESSALHASVTSSNHPEYGVDRAEQLRQSCERLKLEWQAKDRELAKRLEDYERLKQREDDLRRFLEAATTEPFDL